MKMVLTIERTRSAEVDASAPRSFIKHTREEQPPSTSMQSIEAVVAQGIPYMGVWPFSMLADYTWPARPTTASFKNVGPQNKELKDKKVNDMIDADSFKPIQLSAQFEDNPIVNKDKKTLEQAQSFKWIIGNPTSFHEDVREEASPTVKIKGTLKLACALINHALIVWICLAKLMKGTLKLACALINRALIVWICLAMLMKGVNGDTYIHSQPTVKAKPGHDVVLPCTYSTNATTQNLLSLLWTIDGNKVLGKRTRSNERQGPGYEGRVAFVSFYNNASLKIDPVYHNDSGTYRCTVSISDENGGTQYAETKLLVEAAQDRPSQPSIAYLSVLSVTLRWTAGFNGGFRQTFSVMYRVAGRTWPDEAQITGIPDPGENRAVQYKVGNLMSNTTYEFRVRAENERENGKRTSQYTVTIQGKTKAKPSVEGDTLTVTRKPTSTAATASWAEPRGSYSDIHIRVCERSGSVCRDHKVDTSVSRTITLIVDLRTDQLYTYRLQLYDRGDLVYESQQVHSSYPGDGGGGDGYNAHVVGALGGLLAVAVVVIVARFLVVLMQRRQNLNQEGNEDQTSEQSHSDNDDRKCENDEFQVTGDQLDAHTRGGSRVITRDLSDGNYKSEDANQYEQLMISEPERARGGKLQPTPDDDVTP